MSALRLYGNSNTRAFRPLWLLEELGVPFEHVKADFSTGETRSPEFLRLNPNGHVPVLVDGDLVLFESMAINLYLAERYGPGTLLPESLEDRARAVQWSFWAMTECEKHTFDVLFWGSGPQFDTWRAWTRTAEFRETHPGAEPPTEVTAKAAEEALRAPFRVLDAQLEGREWLLGGAFSVADLNVASVLVTVRLARMDLSAHPRLDAWLSRCTSRPAVARAAGR